MDSFDDMNNTTEVVYCLPYSGKEDIIELDESWIDALTELSAMPM